MAERVTGQVEPQLSGWIDGTTGNTQTAQVLRCGIGLFGVGEVGWSRVPTAAAGVESEQPSKTGSQVLMTDPLYPTLKRINWVDCEFCNCADELRASRVGAVTSLE